MVEMQTYFKGNKNVGKITLKLKVGYRNIY